MNAPADLRARPSADEVAAVVLKLQQDFAERAVTSNAVREQHGHGEGMADAALPDVVVFPHTNEEVAANRAAVPCLAHPGDRLRHRHVARGPRGGALWRRLHRPVADEPHAGSQRGGPGLPRAGRRDARAGQCGTEGHGTLLPDRSGRQRDDRRHGLDAGVGHQCRALRHDARERPRADRGHARRPHRQDRRPRAQIRRRLRSHAALRRRRRHAGHHHGDPVAALRHTGGDQRRRLPVPRSQVGRRYGDRRDAARHSRSRASNCSTTCRWTSASGTRSSKDTSPRRRCSSNSTVPTRACRNRRR